MKQMFNSLAAVIANPLATTAGMVGVAVAIVAGNAFAQTATYPVKPVRVLVPFPPGGTPDIHIRFLNERLLARLGQPIVVDNRAGASGNIAMETAARAQPDGYTLIIGTVGNWAVNPHLFKLSYDVLRDFSPVVQIATTPAVLVVHPTVPVHSVKELIAFVTKAPGTLNYGSSGVGGFGHMCAELFSVMTRTRMTHVPYKGAALALTELTGGHIQLLFNSAAMTLSHIKAGRVRALATTGATRFAAMADLPTVAEAGVPGYENTTWSMVAGPAKMSSAVVERLNSEFNAILREPDIRERFAGAGSTVTGTSARQASDILNVEWQKFGRLVRAANIPPATGG
jgi:tripartite-type tricarboxylate transporter receptor subunit TctC